MTKYIYILSNHDEWGAEEVEAASCPKLARRILEKRLANYSDSPEYVAEALASFDAALADGYKHEPKRFGPLRPPSTTEFFPPGQQLGTGWGGEMLHIVILQEPPNAD
jgi:hypothetical protein